MLNESNLYNYQRHCVDFILDNTHAGLFLQMCLLPGGRIFFVEVKSTGCKPTKIQLVIHKRLEALGFKVYVIGSTEKLNNFIKDVR